MPTPCDSASHSSGAQPILNVPRDVAGEAAAAQVVASRARAGIVQEPVVVPLDRLRHRLDELLAAGPLLACGRWSCT